MRESRSIAQRSNATANDSEIAFTFRCSTDSPEIDWCKEASPRWNVASVTRHGSIGREERRKVRLWGANGGGEASKDSRERSRILYRLRTPLW